MDRFILKFHLSKLLIPLVVMSATSCSRIQLFEDHSTEKKDQVNTAQVTTPKTQNLAQKKPLIYRTKTKHNTVTVKKYCEKIDQTFKKYSWGQSKCDEYTWNHVRNSQLGNPIIWYVFGEQSDDIPTHELNSTLIMCGVHGDEITPIKFCFDVMEELRKQPGLVQNKQIIVAPIVVPDSFFVARPSRTNANGVDVNRNFPTKDWSAKALKIWKGRYGKDKRRFPGKYAMSEQETIFQVNLIKRYNPDKVISIHAPLSILDYDGPAFSNEVGSSAKDLLIQMSDHAGKYKISNYPFFPGSLGNWAGNERNIPTYTLELPNSDWHKTDQYFRQFKTAILHAIEHPLLPTPASELKKKYSLNIDKE